MRGARVIAASALVLLPGILRLRKADWQQGLAAASLAVFLLAIPALIAWNYYTKKVEMLAVEMETLCDEFIRRQYREKK